MENTATHEEAKQQEGESFHGAPVDSSALDDASGTSSTTTFKNDPRPILVLLITPGARNAIVSLARRMSMDRMGANS
jgi:hypothetical protein